MNIAFWKMHGAGNDFVLVDDRSLTFPAADRRRIQRLCARRRGVGAEGLILLQPSLAASARMRFFNPDGGEVELCGNGARCAARLAYELGLGGRDLTLETGAGIVAASVADDAVTLALPPVAAWPEAETLAGAPAVRLTAIHTGVPHAVIDVPDVAACDVEGLGRQVRYHPRFAPAGTNVDFTAVRGPRALAVRTYERGVEGETGACGTGVVAAALACARAGRVSAPVEVLTAEGDALRVDFVLRDGGAERVLLTGPAAHAFQGRVGDEEAE